LTRPRQSRSLAGASAARLKSRASGAPSTEDVRGGAARSTGWTTPGSGGTARRSLRSRPHQDRAVPAQEASGAIVSGAGTGGCGEAEAGGSPSSEAPPGDSSARKGVGEPRRKPEQAQAGPGRWVAAGSGPTRAERSQDRAVSGRSRLPAGIGRQAGCSYRKSVAEVGEAHLSRSQVERGATRGRRAERWSVSSYQPLTGRDQLGAGERVRGRRGASDHERNAACLANEIARSRAAGRTDGRRPGSFAVRRSKPAAHRASLARRVPEYGVFGRRAIGVPPRGFLGRIRREKGTEPAFSGASGDRGRQRFRWSGQASSADGRRRSADGGWFSGTAGPRREQ
jgi:hypothetical protein